MKRQNIGETERTVSKVAGGALAVYGLARRNPIGWGLAVLGIGLLRRGMTGYCPVTAALGAEPEDREVAPWKRPVAVRKAVTIQRPRNEVYDFWRDFENLPRFMDHLESVAVRAGGISHWVAKGPAGSTVAWDAEVIADEPDRRIAWRSLPGSEIENSGEVRFADAPGGGTEVRVELTYRPPAGMVGAAVAKLFGEEPDGQIADDLYRLRALLEAGEVPTIDGQPSSRVRAQKGVVRQRLEAMLPDPSKKVSLQ